MPSSYARGVLLACVATACSAISLHSQEPAAPKSEKRVIVLAFDGLGIELIQGAKKGDPPRMPFLARWDREGTAARLLSTMPTSVPSTWASSLTGRSSEGHGIFGLIDTSRTDGRTWPKLGFDPAVSAPPTLFEIAARAGVQTTTVKLPQTFAHRSCAQLQWLDSFPTLDVRRSLGDWFVLDGASEEISETESAGTLIPLRPVQKESGVAWEARIEGPRNDVWSELRVQKLKDLENRLKQLELRKPKGYRESLELNRAFEDLHDERKRWTDSIDEHRSSAPVAVRVDYRPDRRGALVRIGNSEQWLDDGGWSPTPFAFELRSGLDPWPFPSGLRARCSVKLLRLSPPRLFIGPLQMDLMHAPVHGAPAEPRSFGKQLATLGMQASPDLLYAASLALKDTAIDETTVLEALEQSLAQQRRALMALLDADPSSQLFAWCFRDAMQFLPVWQWRIHTNDARRFRFMGADRSASEVLDAFCAELDQIAADVFHAHVKGREDVELIVLSPFGCRPTPRLFDVSTWLAKRGYLDIDNARVPGLITKDATGGTLDGFTVAYLQRDTSVATAFGLGCIQLDERLSENDREQVADEISQALLAERDGEGRAPVQAIYRLERATEAGATRLELRLAFSDSFRSEWNSSLGGLRFVRTSGGELELASPFAENLSAYAGDYDAAAPEGAPGFFFSTHAYDLGAIDARHFPQPGKGSVVERHKELPRMSVLHIAPTVLRRLGVQHTEALGGEPLRDRTR